MKVEKICVVQKLVANFNFPIDLLGLGKDEGNQKKKVAKSHVTTLQIRLSTLEGVGMSEVNSTQNRNGGVRDKNVTTLFIDNLLKTMTKM